MIGAQAVEGDVRQPVPPLRMALVGDLDGVARGEQQEQQVVGGHAGAQQVGGWGAQLLDDEAELFDALQGMDSLTEREVLVLVAHGLTNDEIVERLFLSPLTVKTHANRAMAELGARDRAQLVVIAYQCGLVRAGAPMP